MKNLTITVGIPAFNEEENLKKIIPLLLKQKEVNIREIVVSLDGSKDQSANILKSISSKKISIIINKDRKGIARGINQIFQKSQTEYLVLLDADIIIKNPKYLKRLVEPLVKKRVDVASSKIAEEKPQNYFQEILFLSMRIKDKLFTSIRGGQNLYTCYGLARAFTKRVYKHMTIPTSIGNDMYTYLYCKKNGYKFACLYDVKTYYTLPKNLTDHLSQSTRFLNAIEIQKNYFDQSLITKEASIPLSSFWKATLKSLPLLVASPFKVVCYFGLYICAKIVSIFKNTPQTWSISTSTK